MANERLDTVHGITRRSVEGHGNNNVKTEQHGAFEVVGLAVLDGISDDEDGNGKSNSLDCKKVNQLAKHGKPREICNVVRIPRLTSLKAKRHVAINNPPNNDQEWGNSQRNLNTRANSHTHGEVHLITHRHDNSGNVLSSVTNNGDKNQTNKRLANLCALDNVVDAADEVVCANGDEDGDDDEDHAGSNGAEDGFFVLEGLGAAILVVFDGAVGGGLALGVKEVAVGAELEDEVEDVEEEEDDGGAAREGEDGADFVFGAGLFEDAVELGGNKM